jgi:hypothetical protein
MVAPTAVIETTPTLEIAGAVLFTVTEILLLTVVLPAVLVRTAERRCDPLEDPDVFHEKLNEGPAPDTELPRLEPSSLN